MSRLKQALTVVLLLVCLSNTTLVYARVKQISCKRPKVIRSEPYLPLARLIQRRLDDLLLEDISIRTAAASNKEASFQLEINIRRYFKEPGHHAIFVNIVDPMNKDKMMIFTFKMAQLSERTTNWLASRVAIKAYDQLKIEAAMMHGERLDKNMFNNVIQLNLKNKKLDVAVLPSKAVKKHTILPLPGQKSQRKHNPHEEGRSVLGLFSREKYKTRAVPEEKDPPKDLVDIAPITAEKIRVLKHQPTFNFPSFQTSGFPSLMLMPSLSWHQTHPKQNVSFESETTWAKENFAGSSGSLEKMRFEGNYYLQKFSLSTRLWERINLSATGGLGRHDSEVQMDVLHPSAIGGITFLRQNQINAGQTDLVVAINHHMESRKMIFRPGLLFKFPTGDTDKLMGSGHSDYALSVSWEYLESNWHSAARVSFVYAGDLAVFSRRQAELDLASYVVANLGVGRVLNRLRGERVAWVINYAQNPLRKTSSMKELNDEIITSAISIEKDISPNKLIRAQAQAGLSSSAPIASLAFNFKIKF